MASSLSPDPRPAVALHGGPTALPTLLGNGTNGTPRLPTGGKIRAGIKVLTTMGQAGTDNSEGQGIGKPLGDTTITSATLG